MAKNETLNTKIGDKSHSPVPPQLISISIHQNFIVFRRRAAAIRVNIIHFQLILIPCLSLDNLFISLATYCASLLFTLCALCGGILIVSKNRRRAFFFVD
jgi:hypothetical protein